MHPCWTPNAPLLDTEQHERAVVPPFDKGGPGGISFTMLAYMPQLRPLARRLRAAMTDTEHRLWSRLRRKQLLGVQFYRQKPIGKCTVDFYAPAVALVIEADGGQQIPLTPFSKGGTRSRGVRVSVFGGGTYGT
jgi:hypothetical protein